MERPARAGGGSGVILRRIRVENGKDKNTTENRSSYGNIGDMIQTLEAVVDETGKIRLLTAVHLKKNRRALVTILDEEPKTASEVNVKMPTNEDIGDEDVLNVWAARKESAEEIARELRTRNRRKK
ncbi:MAG: hypothetical protein JSS81_13475 [Acidobacteria bacterium]|nr:hypothetical protein [Acidobacteriota bacterium]